jgi:hypothetical protein
VPGRIQCTRRTAELIRLQDSTIRLERRGMLEVKGKGAMETFWVHYEDTISSYSPRPDESAAVLHSELSPSTGDAQQSKNPVSTNRDHHEAGKGFLVEKIVVDTQGDSVAMDGIAAIAPDSAQADLRADIIALTLGPVT